MKTLVEYAKSTGLKLLGELIVIGLVGYFTVQKSFSDAIAKFDTRMTVLESTIGGHLKDMEPTQWEAIKESKATIDQDSDRLTKIEVKDEFRDVAINRLADKVEILSKAVTELTIAIKKK